MNMNELIHANFVGPEPHVWPIAIYQSMIYHPTVPKLSEKGRVVAENRQISEGGFAFVYLVSWLDRMREMGDFYSSSCENIAIEKPTHQINGGVNI